MARPKRRHDTRVAATLLPVDSESTLDMPFEEGLRDQLDPNLRQRMISEAAYSLYAQRGYVDGYDVDDWLQAEEHVDHVLLNRRVSGTSVERD